MVTTSVVTAQPSSENHTPGNRTAGLAPAAWRTDGPPDGRARWMPRDRLDDLVVALRDQGRQVVGPVLADGGIAIREIEGAGDLPLGWRISTGGGVATLERTDEGRAFDTGPAWSGIKPWTFPSRVDALSFERTESGDVRVEVSAPRARPLAVIGARACDLAALAIHDRVLTGGPAVDPDYAARRADLFVVAVECAFATSTCFCASMGSGPEVTGGADIVLSEIADGLVARGASPAGERLLDSLGLAPAEPVATTAAATQVAGTRAAMGDQRGVAMPGLHDRLLANLDHPRWAEVAARCLACANCTLVCPTCFCTGTVVESDLDGRASTALRTWDSCFTAGFAQVAGGSFRPRHQDRYRQWLTHKFATWQDQFGSVGCVGCGRCIAWCPVGIDVREELAQIAGPALESEPELDEVAEVLTGPAAVAAVAEAVSPATLPLGFVSTTVVGVSQETYDTTTLRIATDDPGLLHARPGQFVMVGVPAFAIPPISISGFHPDGIELTIRAAGPATTFLTRLAPGASLALRGPLGRPWPIEDADDRDVAIIAGGIGLAPLRGLVREVLAQPERYRSVRLYLGARTPRDRLFVREIDALTAAGVDIRQTVDRAGPEWLGRVGIITQLFRGAKPTGEHVTAFVCGPERMMQATVDLLEDLAVPPEHTWLTLERHMECGVGLCGHCQLGTRFVCRDGPVFSVAELGEDLRREGL